MEVVFASQNVHKIREYRDMFATLSFVDIRTLHQFPDYQPPEEIHHTFAENALLKAKHAAKELNCWVLADDSGLVVPSLQGQPGALSRRFAGPDATDSDNRKKLLQMMEGLTGLERAAYYECVIALASPSGYEKCFSGICEGEILTEGRGRNGFGYDSIFQKYDYDKSFAEMDESTKNRISHRRKAFDKLATDLELNGTLQAKL